jgi:predicted nucleic acid-binding Zn ribbon protein
MSDLKCPKCSARIELDQPFCAKCGLSLKAKRSGGFFRNLFKWTGIAFLCLVGIVIVLGVIASRERQAAAETPTTVEVQAAQLASAYDRNGVAADAQFKGRSLRVTGAVVSIGTDMFNHAVVTLDGKVNQFLQPQAVLNESERARAGALAVGHTITLVCTGNGDVIKTPMLKECTLAN